jgi:beta-lactamase regulating signal transducer with metallopeptidase domain
MILPFIVYTIAITVLAALAAHLLERLCISLRKPTREVWLACLAIAVIAPAIVVSDTRVVPSDDLRIVTAQSPLTITGKASGISSERTVSSETRASLTSLDRVLGWAWLAASLGLAFGLARFTHRARRAVQTASPSIVGGTHVLLTDDVGPALVGAFRYAILLPRWVTALPAKQKELIVTHESEHAKTLDPLLLWLAGITIVVFPWNCALWYVVRRLRTSIELDCDRRVLKSDVDAHAYMTLLVDVVERVSMFPSLATALTESRSQLQRRIFAMTTLPRGLSRTRSVTLILSAAILLGAAVRVPLPLSPLPTRIRVAAGDSRNKQDSVTRVYFEYEVTQPATPIAGTGKPVYPASLRAANVKGVVVSKFVVDVTGKVEMNTVQMEQSSNDLFASAVKTALSNVRFEPARLRGMKVRQLVEQAFMFQLDAGTPTVHQSVIDQEFRRSDSSIRDSAAVLARRLEPAAFDRRANPHSSLIGLLFDKEGRVSHHAIAAVPDSIENWHTYYTVLFPDSAQAEAVPYGMMTDVEKGPGSRMVGVVALYLADPRKR